MQKEENLILLTVSYLRHLISARGSVIINSPNTDLVAFYTCSVQEITICTNNTLAEYTGPKGTSLLYSSRTIMSSKVLLPKQGLWFCPLTQQLASGQLVSSDLSASPHELFTHTQWHKYDKPESSAAKLRLIFPRHMSYVFSLVTAWRSLLYFFSAAFPDLINYAVPSL